MKIVKINFENINSLKGHHEIDFSQQPLRTAGLFAITGPTGSGKSTLLDVITLALFNRVPRFKKSISKNEISSLGSIMTHYTKEASASVTYEVKGSRYTSEWRIAKARTGNLRDYHMEIIDPSGKPLDLKKSEVPDKNEELIGLDYEQFVKSIILAQGEFSKFLKADKNERGRLLEDITGATIYRRIGEAAYNRHKQGKEEVEEKQLLLKELEILSDEERTEILHQIEKAKKEIKDLEKEIKSKEVIRTIKVDVKNLEKSISEKNSALNNKLEELKVFEPKLKKLDLHEKISPLRGDVSLYKKEKESINRFFERLTELEKQHITYQRLLNTIIDETQELTKGNVDVNNFRDIITAFERKVSKLDDDLARIKKEGKEKRHSLNTLIVDSTLELTDRTEPTKALDDLRREAEELKATIASAGLKEDSRVDTLTADLKTHRHTLTVLRELRQFTTRISQIDKDIHSKQDGLKTQKDILDKTQPLHTKSTELLNALKENAKLLQKQKEDAIKIAELSDHRTRLQDGDPCPLCGSTEHPYALHLPADQASGLDQKIIENDKQVQEESATEKKLAAEITEAKSGITHLENNLKELRTEKENTLVKKQALLQNQSNTISVDENQPDAQIESLNTKINTLESGIDALGKIKINRTLSKEYQALKNILETYKKKEGERFSITKEKDISKTCRELYDRFDNCVAEKKKIEHSIETDQQNHTKATHSAEKIKDKLHPHLLKHGFGTIEELDLHLLDETEKNEIQNQHQKLTGDKTTLKAEINTLTQTKKDKDEKDAYPDLTLDTLIKEINEKQEKYNGLNTRIGRDKNRIESDNATREKIKSKTKELDKLTAKLERWTLLNQLIGDAKGNKFSNFAQGLTLQHLLALANKRLSHLSDRYLLDKPEGDGALHVIDTYQGNTTRAVSTLSGGETFLLSLALALSLSDMASKNVPLDSLFIDEGFGTLDQETLDMAMDTLERLQSDSQKTVGIISHVEALKERVHVQIQLKKNAQGYSRVEVGHFDSAQ